MNIDALPEIRIGLEKPGDNVISKLIARHDLPGMYSHAAVWFGADAVCEAHIDFGVKFRQYVPDPARWDFIPVDTDPVSRATVYAFLKKQEGKGYDLRGVLNFPLRVIGQDPDKWFCSELVIASMQAIGLFPGITPSACSPNRVSLLASAAAPLSAVERYDLPPVVADQ